METNYTHDGYIVNGIAGARMVRALIGPSCHYCWVIFTSSTAASTRLAVLASAVSIRILTVWPAKALMFTDDVAQTASSLAVLPSSWSTVVVVVPTTLTRKKS